jgi:AmmeMemoRadiSam system protein B
MIRPPAVAGQFYSASAEQLRADVRDRVPRDATPTAAVAAMGPHAGLIYSGRVAGAVYGRLALPSTVILIGPNHTGLGPIVSVFPDGHWVIPGADIPIDREFSSDLLARFPAARADTAAHRLEHCVEVHLPFLLHAGHLSHPSGPLKIVAIVLGSTERALCEELGAALAELMYVRKAQGGDTPLLIASTDMNHYESEEITRRKDGLAIEAIERLDARTLHDRARTHDISMCGLGPAVATVTAARAMSAQRARLIQYATSGEVSGDYTRVVGYAGFVIETEGGALV